MAFRVIESALLCAHRRSAGLPTARPPTYNFQGIRVYMFLRTIKARMRARPTECVAASEMCLRSAVAEVFREAAVWRRLTFVL